MRKVLLLIFCLTFYLLHAQNSNLQFDRLTTADGLSQSTITCIYQDYQGFMWFGTYDGLNKYDGYKFTVYQHNPNDSTSISNNFIWSIHEDAKKNLWIGTRDGLNQYDRELDVFHQLKSDSTKNSLSSNFIRTIIGDDYGNLWIGNNNNGLSYYNHTNKKFYKYLHSKNDSGSLSDNSTNKIFIDSRSNLWVGTFGGKLNVLPAGKKQFEHINFRNESFSSSPVTSIVEDKNKFIWVGTQGDGFFKVHYIPNNKSKITHFIREPKNQNTFSSNIILSLLIDKSGLLWIGTEDAGLNCYHPETGIFEQYPA